MNPPTYLVLFLGFLIVISPESAFLEFESWLQCSILLLDRQNILLSLDDSGPTDFEKEV